MSDLLVRLYDLPDVSAHRERLRREQGIEIRRALAPEKHVILHWVREHFPEAWVSECDVAFAREPVACFVAVAEKRLLGFACHDATCKNFFGPVGVAPDARNKGIGAALTHRCLRAMADAGYAYAIIGWAGAVGFFQKEFGAMIIEKSEPGIYRDLLGR